MNSLHYYRGINEIGHGAFGRVFSAKNIINGDRVAIKFEKRNEHEVLHMEYKVLNFLYCPGSGIPHVKAYFKTPLYNVMVMELLGPSLEHLFQHCKRRFSLKTVLLLAFQMINRVEFIHKKNVLHCDIKPGNFVMSASYFGGKVYIIDFGLAKRYMTNKGHIPLLYGDGMTGTARYASLNVVQGVELSRRDDMESLAYVLIYFLRGSLPWQGLKVSGTKQQRFEKMVEMKQSIKPEELCKGYPGEFGAFLIYCRSMEFESMPNYDMIRRSLLSIFYRFKYVNDNIYDWQMPNNATKLENPKETDDNQKTLNAEKTHDDEKNQNQSINNNNI